MSIMKRALILVACLLATLVSHADTWGDYEYTETAGEVTITAYTGAGGDVVIPSEINGHPVKRIGNHVFYGCTTPTNITIPNSVTIVCVYAFYGCSSLASVTIPNSAATIGYGAFKCCSSLTEITVDSENPNYSSEAGVLFNKNTTSLIQCPEGKSGSYTIPNDVTTVMSEAFSGCTSLTNITIPNSVTTIWYRAFMGCTSLSSVTIPNSVITIGGGTFSGCSSLASITIPNSVITIGEGAFSNCSNLASTTIPNSVTNIGGNAFANCTSLTSVTIPNSVTTIGAGAFSCCSSLASATIGNCVTTIGTYAFQDCTSLTCVTIGTGLTSLEYCAFKNCPSLTGLYFKGNAPNTGPGIFDDTLYVIVYYLPETVGWAPTFCNRPTATWGGGTVATPTFAPDGGTYYGASVTVTANCTTPGAIIRYTTDGSNPTESSSAVMSGYTIPVPVPGVLKAKAWKTGLYPSAIKTASYASSAAPNEPPAPPANVSASKGLYADRVRITWNASPGAASYEIWRQSSVGLELPVKLAEVGGLIYDDLNILCNTTYYYKIKAKNNHGTGAFSEMDAGFIFSPDFGGDLDIRINNLPNIVVNLQRGQELALTINLMFTRDIAIDADWWILVETPFGLYYFNAHENKWALTDPAEITPTYQGALFNFFAPYEILNVNSMLLPAGTYTFHFGIDTLMNGVMDTDVLCYKSVILNLAN